MAKKFNKEELFENFFNTTVQAITTFETTFGIDEVWPKIFGVDASNQYDFTNAETEQKAKDHVRASYSWERLSCLYDYAVDGIFSSMHPEDMVLGGADIISFISTETESPSEEWNLIVSLADGRYGLDEGDDIPMVKIALLADVDIRTVRNAISAGELVGSKDDGMVFIENASARNWLMGRKGFKSTFKLNKDMDSLNSISTPMEFGAFLSAKRKDLALEIDDKKLVVMHHSISVKSIIEIEQGVFKLPIDAIFPIADFYKLGRKDLLSCVMRVFFGEQLSALREAIQAE
jgi:hypothetical protein